MITPELIQYVREELAKGKTREEIHKVLVSEGGWSEEDSSEAFRIVIPMQSFPTQIIKNKKKLSKRVLEDIVFLVFCLVFTVSWYFYKPQIVNIWNIGVNSSQQLSINSWNWLLNNKIGISIPSFDLKLPSLDFDNFASLFNTTSSPQENQTITQVNNGVKDCGISTAPDIKDSKTYQNNVVLNCLGDSALNCEDSSAVLNDGIFPNTFQIIKNKNSCNFKLSYGLNSTLVNISGKHMAGQYISCPISVVKSVDESKKVPTFSAPSTGDSGKYASQIYFYGTIGVFMENSVDQNKIKSLGCSGDYISSVVTSYQKMVSNK